MANRVWGVHQALAIEIKLEKADSYITEYFYGKTEYIDCFHKIADEMSACDSRIMVRFERGIISLGNRNQEALVYLSPIPGNAYEIHFLGEEKTLFDVSQLKKYKRLCEKCVLFQANKANENDCDLIELKSFLNQSQRRFCKLPISKNVRLLAPAGSGKTYSMLWRCKWISNYSRQNGKGMPYFLLITFTRSAAAEIENRLAEDPLFQNIRASVSTLNAWGWNQIKNADEKPVVRKFDRRELVLKDLASVTNQSPLLQKALSNSNKRRKNAELIIDLIDQLKALGFSHEMKKADYNAHKRSLKQLGLLTNLELAFMDFFKSSEAEAIDKKKYTQFENDFFEFWKKAVVRLAENRRFTLEDQKYWAVQYLNESIAQHSFPKGINKYTHIFVDEFQDVNPLDISLINAISTVNGSGKKISLTIIGDDDQAIFGWRGSTPYYILNPEQYLGVKFDTCILDTNYRSPSAIVKYSKNLIEHNHNREPKEMKSIGQGRARVKVVSKQRKSTIDSTMEIVQELLANGCNQIALIGRKQASLFPFQVIMSSQKMSYNVEADIDIFDGEAMKSLQRIIKIVYRAKIEDNDDPVDDLLTIVDKVYKNPINSKEKSLISSYLESQYIDTIQEANHALSRLGETSLDITHVCKIVSSLIGSRDMYDFMTIIENSMEGFKQDFDKADKDNHYKNPQFSRIKELSKKYGNDFRKFYRDIDRAKKHAERCREVNNLGIGNSYLPDENIPIHLLTATRSKGHEFEAVIILDANDGEWPAPLAEDIEEERRLFYVAITRARKYLYFIASKDDSVTRFVEEAGIE